MKTRDEFIKDVFEKSERLRAAEAAARVRKKQRLRVVMGTVSAAACLTLVVGLSGMLDDAFWTRGNDAAAGDAAGEPVILQVQNDGAVQDLSGAEAEAEKECEYEADAAESARQKGNTGDTDMDSRKMNGFADERAVDDSGAKAAAQTQTQGGQDLSTYTEDDAAALWSRDALWETNAQVRDLSVRLFKNAASAKQNSMISPTSILLAMAMVENGAAGDTKKQMEKTFGMRMSELNQWIRAWSAVQPQENADTKSRMNIANAVWYNNRGALTLNPDYQKILREMLQAQVKGGAFSQQTVKEINSWCSKNTYGMIDKLVEELSPAQQMVLLNAVAFEDQWSAQYKKNQVKKEYFTDQNGKKTKTDLMYSKEALYCQDDMATGFIKPYASGYQFVAILPNKGVSVAEYMKKLDGERFAAFVNSGQDAIVHAVLPAFKSEYKTDALVQIFRKMGIKDLFDASAADLSGIGICSGQNLYVDEILHKTYIDVNREGTRAAAVTGVMVKATALNPEPVREYTVRLDRPFLYAIVDSYTGTPVFLGTMVSVE